jgi:hypothetical protein
MKAELSINPKTLNRPKPLMPWSGWLLCAVMPQSSLFAEIPLIGKALMWVQNKLIVTYLTVNGTLVEPKIKSANFAKMKQGTKNTFNYLGDRIHIRKQIRKERCR